jgi:Fur family ferric uptake transcriptional regulator
MQNSRTTQLLLDSGIKYSKARSHILGICLKAKSPLSVADVAAKVGDTAHLATIYRTLETFAAANILTRVDFQEGKFRYEYVHDHHHHAVCEGCGKVAEVQDKKLENLMNNLVVGSGFSITRHALELFGLCRSCQKKG